MNHEHFMRRALELAERGRYSVSPNPMVGCVIVRDGSIIAEGWHERAGEPHAEIKALQSCSDPRGATMYVTLEPCAHQGRTPPCSDAIAAAGLRDVVVAMTDPHDVVNGRGIEQLRRSGVRVEAGILEDQARRLNEKFVHAVTAHSPFVCLKAGMTLDGKLATVTHESRWITGDAARQKSLELREEYDAILVGGGTVRDDDPYLTRRLGWNRSVQPWTRLILDADREVAPRARVLTDGGTTIHITERLDLAEFLRGLCPRGVQSLIVEGGSHILSEFLDRRLWQKMIVFIAPMLAGGAGAPSIYSGPAVQRLTEAYRFRFDGFERIGDDLMVVAYPS